MNDGRTIITVEDLVGSKVITAEGKRVGRVVDVQVEWAYPYRVVGLALGAGAWLHRLHLAGVVAGRRRDIGMPHMVPWEAVARFERFVVTLKPGCEPKAEAH